MKASPRTARRGSRAFRLWCLALALVSLTLLAGAAAWAGSAYVRLVRVDVELVDAWARVKAGGRAHVDLVDNLLREPQLAGAVSADVLGRLRAARDEAGATAAAIAPDPDVAQVARFREAHERLAAVVAAVGRDGERAGNEETRRILAGLGARIDRVENGLRGNLDTLDSAAREYHAASSRFPSTLVAALAAAERLR